MRVLGVVGSPRKGGNTDLLVNKMLEGAESKDIITEKIYLKDFCINECDGCHVCWKRFKCAKNDDMNDLYLKIIESDAIIFGTPVYWYGPTALMKGFIDRFVYFNCPENRTGIKGKKALVVIPFEEKDEDTAAPVMDFFKRSLAYLEMELIDSLIMPGVTVRGEVVDKLEVMKKAYELGKKISGCY